MHFSTEISDNTLSLVGLFSQEADGWMARESKIELRFLMVVHAIDCFSDIIDYVVVACLCIILMRRYGRYGDHHDCSQ